MKNFTLIKLTSIFLFCLFSFGKAEAQKSVDVPGTYATITEALTGEFALLENDGQLIINVAEGIHRVVATGATNTNVTWPAKKLHITIQGAGVDKTFQRAVEGRDARVAADITGTRWMQLSGTAGMEGSSLTFKNFTFQYVGSYSGAAAAGGVINVISDFAIDVKFENMVFDNCVGVAIVNIPRAQNSLTIDNCLFTECVTTPRRDNNNTMRGLIAKDGGKLTVRNTTFYSNENGDVHPTAPSLNGFAIHVNTILAHPSIEAVLENNAFVNNLNKVDGYTAVSPVVSFKPHIEIGEGDFKVSMKNNIMIGNRRAGQDKDVDVYIINDAKITWVASSGNIMNKAFRLLEGGTYEDYPIAGSKIDATYTYGDPRIKFEMDGDLPKLTPDANGIGKVSYSGDGTIDDTSVNLPVANPFKIYAANSRLIIEGLNPGEQVEIFTIIGALASKTNVYSDRYEITLPNGIYVVRSGSKSQKVIVQ